MQTRNHVVLGALAVLLLTAISLVVVAAVHSRSDSSSTPFRNSRTSRTTSCAAPNLTGAVVNVSLSNSGGPMMGGPMVGSGVQGGMMRLTIDTPSVPHGTVSLIATNLGSINHELVILPLPTNQIVGTRSLRADSTVDESSSLGEASNTCGAGAGEGIAPASSSWTTLTLAPGLYELVCNIPGHYAAGMYAQLTVR